MRTGSVTTPPSGCEAPTTSGPRASELVSTTATTVRSRAARSTTNVFAASCSPRSASRWSRSGGAVRSATRCGSASAATSTSRISGSTSSGSVVDARDELAALEDPDLDPLEPHLEPRVAGIEHLLATLDSDHVRADGRHDPGAARGRGGRRGGQDQAGARLGLVAHRLDDEELVEWLEGDVHVLGILEHGRTIDVACESTTGPRPRSA